MTKKATIRQDEPVLQLQTADGIQLVKAKQVVYLRSNHTNGKARYCSCAYYPKGRNTARIVFMAKQTIGFFIQLKLKKLFVTKRGQLVNLEHVEGFGKKGDILFHAFELNGHCSVKRQLLGHFEELLREVRKK
jgi:hypothetical protein